MDSSTFLSLSSVLFFVCGAIVGSFLNVVIMRFGTGRGLGGRSGCGTCGRTLSALDLVPIVSFVFLRGRCRTCHTRLSWQYPLVELLTALIFLAVGTGAFTGVHIPLAFIIVSLGICIGVYDAYHMRIPVVWNYSLVAISVVYVLLGPVDALPSAFFGLCCVAGLFLLTYVASRGRVLGFGDVILAVSIGLLLGPVDGLFAVWLACVIGSLFGLYELVRGTVRSRGHGIIGHQIPFGPFLIAGFFLVFLGYLSFDMLIDIHAL